MKAYAYISSRMETGFIVKIISQSGTLLTAFEAFSYKKAPEFAQKYADKAGLEIQWLTNPWASSEFKTAIDSYERSWGITMTGKPIMEKPAW